MGKSPERTPPMIQVHDISKKFGSNVVLDGLSLEVGRGELFVVLGVLHSFRLPPGARRTADAGFLSGVPARDLSGADPRLSEDGVHQ